LVIAEHRAPERRGLQSVRKVAAVLPRLGEKAGLRRAFNGLRRFRDSGRAEVCPRLENDHIRDTAALDQGRNCPGCKVSEVGLRNTRLTCGASAFMTQAFRTRSGDADPGVCARTRVFPWSRRPSIGRTALETAGVAVISALSPARCTRRPHRLHAYRTTPRLDGLQKTN